MLSVVSFDMNGHTPKSHIFHRNLKRSYPVATGGDGVYLCLSNGRRILDGCSGAAVSCLGHNHQQTMDAVMKQMRTISFAHMLTYTSDVAESLAEVLVGDSGGAFSHVMYATSGQRQSSRPSS